MERAYYRTRNSLGFRHKFMTSYLIMALLSFLAAWFLSIALSPFLYERYNQSLQIQPGSIGSEAQASTPAAWSIDDMKRYPTFTLLMYGESWSHNNLEIKNKLYYIITLESGEKLMARVNRRAVTEQGKRDDYQLLPVGQLKPFEDFKKIDMDYGKNEFYVSMLTTTDYYVDMMGDFSKVMDDSSYSTLLWKRIFVIGLLFTIPLRFLGVRRGWFAPFLFSRKDPLLPRNDLELWSASVYALWAHFHWPAEGWPLMGGMHRGPVRFFLAKSSLKSMWNITSREEGLEVISRLVEPHRCETANPEAAWDLCRAVRLTGLMYLCRMIDRETMDKNYLSVAYVLQRVFSSWDEMNDAYIEGFRHWYVSQKSADALLKDLERLEMLKQKLSKNPTGPYSIPWIMQFSDSIDGTPSTQRVSSVLKNYKPDLL